MYGKHTPAVGFSLSLDTVVQALEPTANHFSEAEAAEELCAVDPNNPVEGFRAALRLRETEQLLRLVNQGGE
jgi:histidyl-tRNA synthetase